MSSYKAWSYRVKYSPRTHQLSACHVRKGQFLFYFFVTVETVCTVCKKKLLLPRKGFGGRIGCCREARFSRMHVIEDVTSKHS